ncbi:MAG: signal recognition particle protein Srp19 [Methanospirillum sp.]|uniref:signal recognition particle subunit SRP19/SEC65 family protein n=1 Tax=Methanospirillum sp. TaxID=45200 RepID=UPI002371FB0B|nr:signal recognition particle subunit SRP19/SEC65 family protein [Methanospirillum sp.]MDD1728990.1 signal recognition particle protein Srp19 [Methanospirillum sp.]
MEKGLILYPCYFDAKLMRKEGRRVPREQAVQAPAIPDIERALASCGVKYRREKKSHPTWWWRHEGRVIADCTGPKTELLYQVATELRKIAPKK